MPSDSDVSEGFYRDVWQWSVVTTYCGDICICHASFNFVKFMYYSTNILLCLFLYWLFHLIGCLVFVVCKILYDLSINFSSNILQYFYIDHFL